MSITISTHAASDYNLLNTSVTLTLAVTSYTIIIDFIQDEIPEPKMEDVEVSFDVVSDDDMVTFEPAASITISIEDDDCMLEYITCSEAS